MKYPKYRGKEFDSLRKSEFDGWRKRFAWLIEDAVRQEGKMTKAQKQSIKVAAWNCAYEVVTDGADSANQK